MYSRNSSRSQLVAVVSSCGVNGKARERERETHYQGITSRHGLDSDQCPVPSARYIAVTETSEEE